MTKLNNFGSLTSGDIKATTNRFPTPFYLYDEALIIEKCQELLSLPNAYGLTVRYAMKANSTKTLLKIIYKQGLMIDASSLNEVIRANLAGIAYKDIILTSQQVPQEREMVCLQEMMLQGLKYNVCSLRQLYNIGDFVADNKISLAIRLQTDIGSGESITRNTGGKYCSFGICISDVEKAIDFAKKKNIVFDYVHTHIGSGADLKIWLDNIDWQLDLSYNYFSEAKTVNFGGGLKERRMPYEESSDINKLGLYAKSKIERFYKDTGRKLHMEIEPGNYLMANAGYIVTTVIDKKTTGNKGMNFIILDGGMNLNTRPLLYGSKHPFYVISKEGALLSSAFDKQKNNYQAVLVGVCCETGDSQCLDAEGYNIPREMAKPEIGDFVVIGGAGAYCSSMALTNYNSYLQALEILITKEKEFKEIRKQQSLSQLLENESE